MHSSLLYNRIPLLSMCHNGCVSPFYQSQKSMDWNHNNSAAMMTQDKTAECECATFPESKHATRMVRSGVGRWQRH